MAISDATINRLNQLSSILNTVGEGVVNKLQNDSDQKLQNASSLINTYYTDSKTGRVAQTINSSTRQNLGENMKTLEKEIGELDVGAVRSKVQGLDQFDDKYVGSALKTFKEGAGTYLASSYIQGASALEQQYKSNAFTAFDNYYSNAYSSYAQNAQSLGDITNAEANFSKIFDDSTVDKMVESGYIPASYRDDYEAFLEEYKGQYGEKWKMQSILYTKAMQDSQIMTDFTNALSADFTIGHATDTFLSSTSDENGNETVEYKIDGATSYAKAKEIYDARYNATNMNIADPNGLRKSGTKTGDTAIWTYTSDSWLYNFGYYTADNTDWVNGDMESMAREWAEKFLSSTSLSADEQKILVEKWISSNFDSSGNPVDSGQIAMGLAQASQDSTNRLSKFINEVDSSSFGLTPTAEDILAKMGEYGMSTGNAYDLQNMTNYMSTIWGFSVQSTDLAYADELSVCREVIASIPHSDLSEYNYGEITYNGETIRTNYYEQIDEMYNNYISANGIEDSEEYKFGFFRAVDNAVLSSTMELSSADAKTLKETAKDMTYDEYVAYISNLRVEGKLPTNYAYQQALALAPTAEYNSEQTKVESMITATLKQSIGDDASNFYMTGVDNYPAIRREVAEKISEFEGDINSEEFAGWLKTYTDNLISAYSAEFNERTFNKIIKDMTGYGSGETKEASTAITKDMRDVFYQYKQGNYDGIVNESAVSNAVAVLTSTETKPNYKDVRDTVYSTLYPKGEGFDKATDAEKSNVLLCLEIATLTAEEQRNIETTFGSYFNSPVIPVQFEGGKQAYLLSSGNNETMVIWNQSVYDNTYMVGLLRGERSLDDYDTTNGGTRTYLKMDDIAISDMFQRTVSGAIELNIKKTTTNSTSKTGISDEAVKAFALSKPNSPTNTAMIELFSENADSPEELEDIVYQLKMYHSSGAFAKDKDNFDEWINGLAESVKKEKNWGETKAVTESDGSTVKYVTIGRDGNFQKVLQTIGHKGKGITL